MTFLVQLLYCHPSCRLIQLQGAFPWTDSAFAKHVGDGTAIAYLSAALTQLCGMVALVPASALREERGRAYEIGLCSFSIGTDTYKSKEILLTDCLCWGGRIICKRD